MNNPFDQYLPEQIEPIPPNVINFSVFMRGYQQREQLTANQTFWFLSQLSENVPLYLLCLWQGFPEWEVTNRHLADIRIQLRVSRTPTEPRYLAFLMAGHKIAETKI